MQIPVKFHVKTTPDVAMTPDEKAAAEAAKEQCKSAAREIVRDCPIWFLAASYAGKETVGDFGSAETRALSSQNGDIGHLLAFWSWVAQEVARQLAEVAEVSESDAAVWLMREMMAHVALKDIPGEDEPA